MSQACSAACTISLCAGSASCMRRAARVRKSTSTGRLTAVLEIFEDRTIGTVIAFASGRKCLNGITHRDQSLDLGVDLTHMLEGKLLHIGAGAGFVLPEIKQPPNAVNRKAEIAGAVNETQHADIGLRIEPVIAVAAAGRLDQTGRLVIADCLGRDARCLCCLADIHKVRPLDRYLKGHRSRWGFPLREGQGSKFGARRTATDGVTSRARRWR